MTETSQLVLPVAISEGTKKRVRSSDQTPVMQQYFQAKAKAPDALLFFRMGDFYEMFFEDAEIGARALDLTLTSRSKTNDAQKIPMAGVPAHSAPAYITKLLEQGFKVALCEQLADPSKVKGIVPRDIVRIITPGLALDPDALDPRTDNTLVAVHYHEARSGAASLELSRSELELGGFETDTELLAYLIKREPRELLWSVHEPSESASMLFKHVQRMLPRCTIREFIREEPKSVKALQSRCSPAELSRLSEASWSACDSVCAYAESASLVNREAFSKELDCIRIYDPNQALLLDDAAVTNLELVTTYGGRVSGSLLSVLDETVSPMGARLFRRRLLTPSSDLKEIVKWHDAVAYLLENTSVRRAVREAVLALSDIERLAARMTAGLVSPRELVALRTSLKAAASVFSILRNTNEAMQNGVPVADDVCDDVREKLEQALVDDPIAIGQTTAVFRSAYHPELTELRSLASSGKDRVLQMETEERAKTRIPTLKIRFSRVFGYTLEVSKSYVAQVPSHYRRKQTIAGGERFVTDDLDALQTKILTAEEKLKEIENKLFSELRNELAGQVARIRMLGAMLAEVDVLASLSEIAHRKGYMRPLVDESMVLELEECRHPVLEHILDSGQFVPNTFRVDAAHEGMMIITGPNMAGKSTVMRQAALSVIMAQMGSFVPAKRARIGLVDRIFTRVGASDNLTQGQSTFMVEMAETANILRGATRRSLVIVDEIGRGTSTYDGLAIAQSVAEFLHDRIQCRTLFATHYHEIAELGTSRKGVINTNVSAKEHGGAIVFLYRLAEGSAKRSFGVAVAELAGLPREVIARAEVLLHDLEQKKISVGLSNEDVTANKNANAPSFIEQALLSMDINAMTPLDALSMLAKLQEKARTA